MMLILAVSSCSATSVGNPSSTISLAPTTTTTSAASAGWVEVAPMDIARSEHPGVVLNDEIVVSGGFIEVGVGRIGVTDSVEAYSPGTDSWRDLPDLPEPRHHGMAAVVGDRLFALGGYAPDSNAVNTVWELVADGWTERAPMPGPVAAGAAVVIDDSIFVVGGTPLGGLYRYESTNDAWTELATPLVQREHVAAVALGGEVWAIAGRWQGEIFSTTEIFDSESGAWRPGPTLNHARSGFGAVVVDDAIVVAGGEVFSPDEALDSVERLDPETGAWSPASPLPVGLHGNPLVALGSDLYLPGGSTLAAGVVNDGRTYRMSSG